MLVLFAVFFIGGCAVAPSAEQLAAADYGSPINQIEAQVRAEAVLKQGLKDPYSARFRWKNVTKGWMDVGMGQSLGLGDFRYGYYLRGAVNAKNGFGAYVGERKCQVLFHNGKIVTYGIDQY